MRFVENQGLMAGVEPAVKTDIRFVNLKTCYCQFQERGRIETGVETQADV
jgi:hypothetical protein